LGAELPQNTPTTEGIVNPHQINQALKNVTLGTLVGPPGSGKEFTGDHLLSMQVGYNRIIMSDLLARETGRGSALGMLIKQYQDAGQMAPDEHVIDLFFNGVAGLYADGSRRVISDGFPRTPRQGDQLLERTSRFLMFFIEVPIELAIERMLRRGRPGETRAFCEHRQGVFEKQTRPMIEYFKAHHPDNFIEIDGTMDGIHRATAIHEKILQFDQTLVASHPQGPFGL
jgi:adenylate kinase